MKIAVCLSSYNRKAVTIRCLQKLSEQVFAKNMEVILCDDNSHDGTVDAVHILFPNVRVIRTCGELYWAGAMRVAIAEAMRSDIDFLLLMNDDVDLQSGSVERLILDYEHASRINQGPKIIVGSTQSAKTGKITYGGYRLGRGLCGMKFERLLPRPEALTVCDTFNANCVLVDRKALELVGNLSSDYSHYLADLDYGLRATRHGIINLIARHVVGYCENNLYVSDNFRDRLKKINHPKGFCSKAGLVMPFWEWKRFCQNHGGLFWPLYWLTPYRRLFF